MVFTSLKGGDLDIYTMNIDGSDVKQLTDARRATTAVRGGRPMARRSSTAHTTRRTRSNSHSTVSCCRRD